MPDDNRNILQEAMEITSGDRNSYYGHPLDNHTNTAEFWSGYLFRKHGVRLDLSARDVCLMMVLLKVSRDANAPKRDNLVDIVGYTRNIEMIADEEAKRVVFESKTRKSTDEFKDALYIAGPMRGYPRFNFDMFERVTRILRGAGMKIASPHEHDLEMGLDPDKTQEEQPTFSVEEAFKWDLAAVLGSKGIVLLPGWETSEGARTEAKVALFCGKEIWVWDPIPAQEEEAGEQQLIRLASPEEAGNILHRPLSLHPKKGKPGPYEPKKLKEIQIVRDPAYRKPIL